MAYDLKQFRVLGSGLNWIAPSDLIEDQEAIELQNLRVDEFGSIRSRPGHAAVVSGLGVVHSLIKANGIRYSGDTTSLHRALAGAAIASGFDGNPLGMISWRSFLLISNKNNPTTFNSPVKDNGTTVTRMVPAAPAAAPVVSKQAERTTNISTFENSETWTESAGTKTFDNTAGNVKVGTYSLKMVVVDPGIYTVTRTTTPNLNSVGGQTGTDDDKHRIWLKVDDFSQVGDINLLVDVSAAADFSEYYIARIPRKKFKKASGQWIQFELRRASTAMDVLVADPGSTQLLQSVSAQEFVTREEVNFADLGASARALISGEALTFERVGNDDTRDWSTVTQIRVQIEALGPNTVRMDSWEVFGSALGALEGKLVHYYTYTTADGTESNPSPGSTRQKFNRISAGVALIASADSQVTGINVYRGGGSLGETYRVNGTTPIANTTATYADVNSDETLFTDGFIIETDHDDPPAAAILVGPYFGRTIAASSTANLNRYWWSAVNRLYFPGSGDAAGNWNDVGPAGEAIVAITNHGNYLRVFKGNSIWEVVGDPNDSGGQYEITGIKHGCVGPKAVITGEAGDYFADFEGVYLLAGRTVQKISLKIEPIFRGQTVTLATGVTIPPISSSARAKIALELINGRLYMSYPESGQSNNNVTLVYLVASGEWKRDSRGFSALYNEGNNVLLGGTAAGAVVQLESGVSDATVAIAVVYQSKYVDCGAADAEKTFEDFEIEYDSPSILTVTAYLNNGATSVALGTVPVSTGRQKRTLQFAAAAGTKAFNCSIRITGSSSAGEIVVYGKWLHFYLEARKASSFDTDETDFGTPGVKELRQIELDIDCAATTTLNVLTDLPSNAMASRQTPTIPLTAGRRVIATHFSSRWRGYLSRFYIDDSTAQFQLYGARCEYKVVGDYIIANEVWDSDELSYNSEKVKAVRSIQVELENTAAVTVTIFSDLPGGVLALRDTVVIPIGATRRTVEVPFTANAEFRGRSFRVKMTSTADWALYGASLESKVVGTYVASGAGALYNSDELDFGSPKPKGVRALQIELENAAAVTVKIYSDLPGGTLALRDTLTIPIGATRRVVELPFAANAEYRGHIFKVTMTSTADWVLYSGNAELRVIGTYVFGGSSKNYNSDELSFGTNHAKGMRALQVELDANTAAVTVQLYSDLPGGTMALRDTLTIAIGTTRRVVDIPFAAGAEYRGRIFKIKMSSAADFILYEIGAETRVIGTYVFGSAGKIYDSGEIDWNSERVKLSKEVELDVETSATLTLVAQSDIPGGVLATRVAKTAATTGGVRKTVKLRLPGTFQGRLHRFKLSTSATDFIVYAARVLVKTMGTPGATPWNWQELPLEATRQGIWAWTRFPLEETSEGIWNWGTLPVEKTNENAWGWGKLPVTATGSNEWKWHAFPIDRAA